MEDDDGVDDCCTAAAAIAAADRRPRPDGINTRDCIPSGRLPCSTKYRQVTPSHAHRIPVINTQLRISSCRSMPTASDNPVSFYLLNSGSKTHAERPPLTICVLPLLFTVQSVYLVECVSANVMRKNLMKIILQCINNFCVPVLNIFVAIIIFRFTDGESLSDAIDLCQDGKLDI